MKNNIETFAPIRAWVRVTTSPNYLMKNLHEATVRLSVAEHWSRGGQEVIKLSPHADLIAAQAENALLVERVKKLEDALRQIKQTTYIGWAWEVTDKALSEQS